MHVFFVCFFAVAAVPRPPDQETHRLTFVCLFVLQSFLSVSELIKTTFVVAAGSQKCGKTKDHNSLLTSAQDQSHANGLENYFHHHRSKKEPLHPLPCSQPRPWGPTLLFVLAPASSLFTHIQTTRTREFRRALQQVRDPGGKWQGRSNVPQ